MLFLKLLCRRIGETVILCLAMFIASSVFAQPVVTTVDLNGTPVALSGDGNVVLGQADGFVLLWTSSGGRVVLDPLAAWPTASAINYDGSVVVGTINDQQAFRWTSQTGMVAIPRNDANTFVALTATGVSADGRIVTGQAFGGRAYRWNSSTGVTELLPSLLYTGDTAVPHAISADGLVVVGIWTNSEGISHPFRWVSGSGVTQIPNGIGMSETKILAVTNDGTSFIGSALVDGQTRGVRWNEATGMTLLPVYEPATTIFSPKCSSGDLAVCAGAGTCFCLPPHRAFIGSTSFVVALLRSFGPLMSVDNDLLDGTSDVAGMSADGSKILCTTYSPDQRVILISGVQSGGGPDLSAGGPGCPGTPFITTQPANQSICPEPVATAVFSVTASGLGVQYQWRHDLVPLADVPDRISGSSTPVLTLNNIVLSDSGSYDCVVSNGCGSAASAPATLVVCVPVPNLKKRVPPSLDHPNGQWVDVPEGSITGGNVRVCVHGNMMTDFWWYPLVSGANGFAGDAPSTAPWRVLADKIMAAEPGTTVLMYSWIAGAVGLPNQSSSFTHIYGEILALTLPQALASNFTTNGGQIHLIGHSHGSLVATLAANRLAASGLRPRHLTIFDSPDGFGGTVLGANNNLDQLLADLQPGRGLGQTFVDNYYSQVGRAYLIPQGTNGVVNVDMKTSRLDPTFESHGVPIVAYGVWTTQGQFALRWCPMFQGNVNGTVGMCYERIYQEPYPGILQEPTSGCDLSSAAFVATGVHLTTLGVHGVVNFVTGLVSLEEHSPAGWTASLTTAQVNTSFVFDYSWTQPGDGDQLAILIDGQTRFLSQGDQLGTGRRRGEVDIGDLAPGPHTIAFELYSVGTANAVIEVSAFGMTSSGCGSPVQIVDQPAAVMGCMISTANFSITASGSAPAYQWEWQPGGPGTAWAGLGEGINTDSWGTPAFDVSGAITASVGVLSMFGQGGEFRCIVSNACGSIASDVATLTVLDESDPACSGCPACPADYDNNGGVDGGDLAAFFLDFEAGETCADVDQNGGVDGGDLGYFFQVFEAGGC